MGVKLVALTDGLRKENEPRRFDSFIMLKFKTFTGGDFATNCFLVEAPQGGVLFDAPEGADEHFAAASVT